MPGISLGISLAKSLEIAEQIIKATLAGERTSSERHIAVAVCDAEASPVWFEGVTNVAQQTMGLPLIGSKGGVIIKHNEGHIIGAVGEAGEQDEKLACLGIECLGLVAVTK